MLAATVNTGQKRAQGTAYEQAPESISLYCQKAFLLIPASSTSASMSDGHWCPAGVAKGLCSPEQCSMLATEFREWGRMSQIPVCS